LAGRDLPVLARRNWGDGFKFTTDKKRAILYFFLVHHTIVHPGLPHSHHFHRFHLP
jgi:hypothetical protein